MKHITHSGIIEQVTPGQVLVRIQPQTACGKCAAHSHCGLGDDQGKLIEVSLKDATAYQAGQAVTLVLQQSLGYRALWLGYLLPFLLLLASLIILVNTTGNDALAAIVSLGLMLPYYAILFRLRHRLRKRFEFRIQN